MLSPLRSEIVKENENRQRQPPLILTSHTIYIPDLVDKYVFASTHGWLVLVDMFKDDCCLWNPGSKDMIKLPVLEDFYLYKEYDMLLQAFCKIADDEFVCPTQVKGVDRLIAITSFQGKIYGVMSNDYVFGTIEFVGRTMELRPISINGEQLLKAPVINKNWVVWNEIDLIGSHTDNSLLFVMKDLAQDSITDGSEFRVFRVDINRMECIEVDDIGDQVILIGHYGTGFCCSSSGTTFKPNSIYYIVKFESCAHVYNLDDKSTTSWLPHDVGLKNIYHFGSMSSSRN
ncbi:hypothetical protein CASFOL_035482 [Castilleja foliolosa]|uniref:KIB1-4 beta-propeller domain-containing protein n=1 Tax=Castilleja foliolosa TaxID=1961234 RepID=A0ABD3BSZ9_9LAMI